MLKCFKYFGPPLHPSLMELKMHVHVQAWNVWKHGTVKDV